MEVLKTFGAALIFLMTLYVLFFIASLGWNEGKAIVEFLIDIKAGSFE
jgi:hypothetical protein